MFSVFYNQFNKGLLISLEIGSLVTFSGILRLPTMFDKKIFKTLAVFSSFETISFSSIKVTFYLDVIFPERKVLTVFQNVLLSATFFS